MPVGRAGAAPRGTTFGELLRALRERASLTQEELADRAGLTTHGVSALERGVRTRPYPHTIRALAGALGLGPEERRALVEAVPPRRPPAEGSPGPRPPAGHRDPGGSLPVPTTPLLGREAELAHLVNLLHDPGHRIVTLTGIGGVGKTRLALAAAHEAAGAFPDGVVLVELAPLADPVLVLPAVADALATGGSGEHDAASVIVAALGSRQVLLVLDNVEHLLPAVAAITRIVEACPGVTLLATSRAPLRARGEHEVRVAPLPAPADGTAAALDGSPAAALFLERARAAVPDLRVDEAGGAAVAEICRRLAGIPLAVELAAAHVRYLDPVTLAGRLDSIDSADGARDLPRRQRTMHAAIDWSYTLLAPGPRSLLRLLSTFVGTFDLEAVEGVVRHAGAARPSVLDDLRTLVEQSLVTVGRHDGATSYRLLEPVVQYARTRLVEEGEDTAVDAAHLRFHVELAERAYPHFQTAQQVEWLVRVDRAHADMTVAVERALAGGSPDDAARIGWALWLYWWLRGHVRHGRRVMSGVLEAPLSGPVRTRAEIALATMCFAGDDVPTSRSLWDSARRRADGGPDVLSTANAVAGVGLTDLAAGDLAAARARFTEALPLAQQAGSDGEWLSALVDVWLGTVLLLEGDAAAAERRMTRGLESAHARGDRLTTYVALFNLSQVAGSRGDLPRARHHLAEGMRLSVETGDLANLAHFLEAAAVLEGRSGRTDRVPLLVGAAQAVWETTGVAGYGYYRVDEELARRTRDLARETLGPDTFDDLLDAGRCLDPAAAAATAFTD